MSSVCQESYFFRKALESRGLETPLCSNLLVQMSVNNRLKHMKNLCGLFNLAISDNSLAEAPKCIAKMYVDKILFGLNYKNFPKITLIENKMDFNEMVMVSNITLTGVYEHPFVTTDGKATVAYIPKHKIVSLSKINHIMQFFSHWPQVQ